MQLKVFILLLGLLMLNCEQKEPEPEIIAPTDLTLHIEVSDDGSGLVTVEAIANNVNYYEFQFGESGPNWSVRDDDGNVEHKYTETGTYSIIVSAHATEEIFVEATSSIDVIVNFIPTSGFTSPETYEGYDLVWADEFDGTTLDTDVWKHELGNGSGGWGNNELQYYRKENTTVQDGYLVIKAQKENYSGKAYTSSRIVTMEKKVFKYGRIDIRAALPKSQGIWPALWMLGSNFTSTGWPACGEIDIMELIGGAGKDNTVHGTVHWDQNGNYASYGKGYSLPSGIFAEEFHVFTIIWDEAKIEWFVDDVKFNAIDITPAALSEFNEEFFFIFNVAVGGNWPGSPDGTTAFPQRMIVDYVRVFQPN